MDVVEAEALIEIFRQQAATERHQLEMVRANDRFDDERKKHKERERQEQEEREWLERLTEAPAAQIAAFRETLDEYDTATVRALMVNQKALDEVHDRRDAMEAAANRLPDGRLVFKTEDGKRVFDKDGVQLSHDVVHPDAVPDAAPRWETYKGNRETERALLYDRDKLHAYQHRLDETREAIDHGHISADALEKMDIDLRKSMPDTVKAQLQGTSAPEPVAELHDAPNLARTIKPSTAGQVPAGP